MRNKIYLSIIRNDINDESNLLESIYSSAVVTVMLSYQLHLFYLVVKCFVKYCRRE